MRISSKHSSHQNFDHYEPSSNHAEFFLAGVGIVFLIVAVAIWAVYKTPPLNKNLLEARHTIVNLQG